MKLEEVNTRTKEAVDFLVAALESGHSEVLTAYLGAMAKFHTYSFLRGHQHRKHCVVRHFVAEEARWRVGMVVRVSQGHITCDSRNLAYIRCCGNALMLSDSAKPQFLVCALLAHQILSIRSSPSLLLGKRNPSAHHLISDGEP
jgi:hypothetical protein